MIGLKLVTLLILLLPYSVLGQQPRLMIPAGHTDLVICGAFSPDGKKVVTGSWDKTVKLWNAETGILLADLKGHAFATSVVLFSPDGKKIASEGGGIRLWNAETGVLLDTLNDLTLCQFSNDGKRVLTRGYGEAATVWDSETGEVIKKVNVEAHRLVVTAAALSPDNSLIATGSYDSTLKVWNVETGELKLDINAHSGEITSVAFSPGGEKILTVSKDSSAKIWNSTTGHLLAELRKHSDEINTAFFSYDGKKVITASLDSTAKVWDALSGELLLDLAGHKHGVTYASFSPDGKKIITASYDDTARIWDAISGKLLVILGGHQDYLSTAIFSANGLKVLTTSNDKTCKIWSSADGRLLTNLTGYSTGISRVRLSPDNKTFITGFIYDHDVRVWNAKTGVPVADLKDQGFLSRSPAFSPDGTKLVTYSTEEYSLLSIWNYRDLTRTCTIKLDSGLASSLYSPDGKILATVSDADDKVVNLWRSDNGTLLGTLENSSAKLSEGFFSNDSKKIISIDSIRVNVWDIETAALLFSITNPDAEITHALFSPDGRKILTISRDRTGRIFDAGNGALILELKGETTAVRQAVFSPDSKKIAAVVASTMLGPGSGVKIWDVEKGELLLTLKGSYYIDFRTARFSKSSDKLITTSGVVADPVNHSEVWDAGTGVLLHETRFEKRFSFMDLDYENKTFIATDNNELSFFELSNNTKMVTIIPIDTMDYFVQLPSKYYTSSINASKRIYYVSKDLKIITFDQLDIKYNRPDLVLQAMGNTDTTLILSYRRAYEKRVKKLGIDTTTFREGFSIPEADFINRDLIPYEQQNIHLALHIKGLDSTYHLDRFNVWVNETPLFGQRGVSIRRRNRNDLDTVITIRLSRGENRIETSITNVNGTESYRMPLLVNHTPAVNQKESVRFIGIGMDKFSDSKYNLQYSSKDIRDLSKKLKEKYGDDITIDTVFNENVTVSSVQALKQKLLQTTENDKVIVAYSGHGMLSKDFDYYLSTYSVNFDKPEENGLPYEELENLLDSIPARKKLMLIDACHSGEVDKEDLVTLNASSDSLIKGLKPVAYKKEGQLGLKNSFELMQSLFVNVGKSTGATIISAAAGTQFALERNDLKNGVFTYAILEAMNKYPTLKISELKKIVGERVEQLTKGLQKPTSRNETIAVDWNIW